MMVHRPSAAIAADHDQRVHSRRAISPEAVEGEAGRTADRAALYRKDLETVGAGREPLGDLEHGGWAGGVKDLEILEEEEGNILHCCQKMRDHCHLVNRPVRAWFVSIRSLP